MTKVMNLIRKMQKYYAWLYNLYFNASIKLERCQLYHVRLWGKNKPCEVKFKYELVNQDTAAAIFQDIDQRARRVQELPNNCQLLAPLSDTRFCTDRIIIEFTPDEYLHFKEKYIIGKMLVRS